jgi:hypothetical protein
MQRLLRLMTGIFLSLTLLLLPASHAEAALDATRYIKGESRLVGKGEVFTWIRVDKKTGIPRQLGISVTPKAMQGLPADDGLAQPGSLKLKLIDGSPYHNFEYELMFPKEADRTAFSHMGFNWNPEGHGPLPGVFYEPHFDVHFYMATPEYRHSITNDSLSDDLHVQNIEPPRPFLPEAYKRAPNTSEPRMGTHYADMTSEQLKPGKFDNIFLFGGHDGNVLFWEPMLTRNYLLSKPNFHEKIQQPMAFPVSGYYPLSYSVKHNKKTGNIDISLDELTLRASSYPNNVYGVDPCIDSRMADIIFKYRDAKPEGLDIPDKCKSLLPVIEKGLS